MHNKTESRLRPREAHPQCLPGQPGPWAWATCRPSQAASAGAWGEQDAATRSSLPAPCCCWGTCSRPTVGSFLGRPRRCGGAQGLPPSVEEEAGPPSLGGKGPDRREIPGRGRTGSEVASRRPVLEMAGDIHINSLLYNHDKTNVHTKI